MSIEMGENRNNSSKSAAFNKPQIEQTALRPEPTQSKDQRGARAKYLN